MNTIESALYAILAADVTVAGLVGTRIFPNVVPQDQSLPAISYQRIATSRVWSLEGPSGLAQPTFQVNCLAATYDALRTLSAAVRAALDGYSGTASSVAVSVIRLIDEGDLPEVSPANLADRVFGRRMDFQMYHEE